MCLEGEGIPFDRFHSQCAIGPQSMVIRDGKRWEVLQTEHHVDVSTTILEVEEVQTEESFTVDCDCCGRTVKTTDTISKEGQTLCGGCAPSSGS